MPRKAQKYDIYHDSFTDAMKHAYEYAKSKFDITIDDDEIWDKVSSGPRKPSKGKTNRYRLEGDKGNLQIQVYNTGNKYELNMYKEDVDMDKRENIVKSMKKDKAGFEKRYGDRWKSVMYATATKMAKEENEMVGWIAIYNGKKVEIKKNQAKDLWGAKQIAIKMLKVPKSKQGLLAIKPAYNEDFDLPDEFLLDEAIDPKVKAKARQFLSRLKSKTAEYTKKYGPKAQEVMQQTAMSMATKALGAAKATGRTAADLANSRKPVGRTLKRAVKDTTRSVYRNAKSAGKLAIKGADKVIDRINKEEVELDEAKKYNEMNMIESNVPRGIQSKHTATFSKHKGKSYVQIAQGLGKKKTAEIIDDLEREREEIARKPKQSVMATMWHDKTIHALKASMKHLKEETLDEKVDNRKTHQMYKKDGTLKHDMRFKMYRNSATLTKTNDDVVVNDGENSGDVELQSEGVKEGVKNFMNKLKKIKKRGFNVRSYISQRLEDEQFMKYMFHDEITGKLMKYEDLPDDLFTSKAQYQRALKRIERNIDRYVDFNAKQGNKKFKKEETLHESNLNVLRGIVKKKQADDVKLGGARLEVDSQTANAIVKLFDVVNDDNKKKLERMINSNETNFMKVVDFAFSKSK